MKKSTKIKVHIRWMIRRDMPQVLDVEWGADPYPWYEEDFLNALRERNNIAMVAVNGEDVVGFFIYGLHKHHIELVKFAVRPEWQRMNVGSQMVKKMQAKLSSHRRTRLLVDVRETNLAALNFFKAQGFIATSVVRGYFDDSGEDAFRMEHTFPGAGKIEVPEEERCRWEE